MGMIDEVSCGFLSARPVRGAKQNDFVLRSSYTLPCYPALVSRHLQLDLELVDLFIKAHSIYRIIAVSAI